MSNEFRSALSGFLNETYKVNSARNLVKTLPVTEKYRDEAYSMRIDESAVQPLLHSLDELKNSNSYITFDKFAVISVDPAHESVNESTGEVYQVPNRVIFKDSSKVGKVILPTFTYATVTEDEVKY